MPVVSAPNLALLRSEGQSSKTYFSILVPDTIWTARINGTVVLGQTDIPFDGGAGTHFTLVGAIQEVLVGSSAGADDIGRLRTKDITSADAGVTGTLTVSGHSLSVANNQYLTFLFHYPLKPRWSFVDEDEIFYMDDDVEYDDDNNNEEPFPVVIAGPYRSEFLIPGPGTQLGVDASNSYPIDQTATITTYGLSVLSTVSTPATVVFDTGTGIGGVTFFEAGYYWLKFTVTDSNGMSQDSYRLYFIHSQDKSDPWYPFVDYMNVQLSDDWDTGGKTLGFNVHDNLALSEIPDQTVIVVWQTQKFNFGVLTSHISFLPEGAKTLFCGYIVGDVAKKDLPAGFETADFVAKTIEYKLRRRFGFSVSIKAEKSGVNKWWEMKNWFYMGAIIHHIWRWRSTLFEIADVINLDMNLERRAFMATQEGALYDMANAFSANEGIRAKLNTDQGGRIRLTYDQQLLNDTDRAALTTVMDLTTTTPTADYGGPLVVQRSPENAAPFITTNGSYWDGTFDGDGQADIEDSSWCFIAPGGKPDWDGPNPRDFPKQMFRSLTHGKEIAGRLFAKVNNPTRELRLGITGSAYIGVLDCAYDEQFTITLLASEHPRGIAWTNKPLYLRNVTATLEDKGGAWTINIALEPENPGFDGLETDCPSFPEIGGVIPEIELPEIPGGPTLPPGGAFSTGVLTGASVYYLPDAGTSWTQMSTQSMNDMCIDPYWRIKTAGVEPGDLIVWAVGDGFIKRSEDGGVTFDDVGPSPFPDPDGQNLTVADVDFVRIDASYINPDTFVVLGNWEHPTDTYMRSFILKTEDNGANWTWEIPGRGYLDPADPNVFAWETEGRLDSEYHTAIEVDSQKLVIAYRKGSGANNIYVRAVTFAINGASATLGDPVRITPSNWNELRYLDVSICKVTTDKFAVGFYYSHPTHGTTFATVIGTVTGRTIALGTVTDLLTDDEKEGLPELGNLETFCNNICAPNATTLMAVHPGQNINQATCAALPLGANMWYGLSGTITGNEVSWPTMAPGETFPGGGSGGPACYRRDWQIIAFWQLAAIGQNLSWNLAHCQLIAMGSGDRWCIYTSNYTYDGVTPVGYVSMLNWGTANGPTITTDIEVVIDPANYLVLWDDGPNGPVTTLQYGPKRLVRMTNDYAALVYPEFVSGRWRIKGCIVDVPTSMGTSISLGSQNILHFGISGLTAQPGPNLRDIDVARQDNTHLIVAYAWRGEGRWLSSGVMRVERTGSTDLDTVNEQHESVYHYGNVDQVFGNSTMTSHAVTPFTGFADKWIHVSGWNSGLDWGTAPRTFVADYNDLRPQGDDIPLNGHLISASQGKNLGTSIWVTLLDPWAIASTELKVLRYSLQTLDLERWYNLGGSTQVQLDGLTRFAAPHVPFGSDFRCYVYGDMTNVGLISGQDAKLLRTFDNGTTWVKITDNMSVLARNLLVDLSGKLYATSGGSIFVDDNDEVMVAKAVLNSGAAAVVHGMALDYYKLYLYTIGDDAEADMVDEIAPAYTVAVDITFDHGTANPGKAIIKI